jgi:hypothetical protein
MNDAYIDDLIGSEVDKLTKLQTDLLLAELISRTPVDTGLAASSWRSDPDKGRTVISNEVPYIEYLNAGSSKQAPSHFIESTALEFGKAVGTIVTIK